MSKTLNAALLAVVSFTACGAEPRPPRSVSPRDAPPPAVVGNLPCAPYAPPLAAAAVEGNMIFVTVSRSPSCEPIGVNVGTPIAGARAVAILGSPARWTKEAMSDAAGHVTFDLSDVSDAEIAEQVARVEISNGGNATQLAVDLGHSKRYAEWMADRVRERQAAGRTTQEDEALRYDRLHNSRSSATATSSSSRSAQSNDACEAACFDGQSPCTSKCGEGDGACLQRCFKSVVTCKARCSSDSQPAQASSGDDAAPMTGTAPRRATRSEAIACRQGCADRVQSCTRQRACHDGSAAARSDCYLGCRESLRSCQQGCP